MISFAITVCNEHEELKTLLDNLDNIITEDDEVVLQYDSDKVTEEVLSVIWEYRSWYQDFGDTFYKVIHTSLNNDFARFKNNLIENCSKKWIFQLDADEYLNDKLLYGLHDLLKINDKVEMIHVPRINIVKNIGQREINMWGWQIQRMEGWTEFEEVEVDSDRYRFFYNNSLIKNVLYEKEIEGKLISGFEYYEPIINFPDYQTRLFKNDSKIRWTGKVHEKIIGFKIGSHLPLEEQWSLIHKKTIERQTKQNTFYNNI